MTLQGCRGHLQVKPLVELKRWSSDDHLTLGRGRPQSIFVELVSTRPVEPDERLPRFVEGRWATPPEDIGGPPFYALFKQACVSSIASNSGSLGLEQPAAFSLEPRLSVIVVALLRDSGALERFLELLIARFGLVLVC